MQTTLVLLILALLLPVAADSACGPPLLVQAPVNNRFYSGPLLLEGDVYAKDVKVTVTVDGVALPVKITVLNPGRSQFYRWGAGKYKKPGKHTAVITASTSAGSTVETNTFTLVIAEKPKS